MRAEVSRHAAEGLAARSFVATSTQAGGSPMRPEHTGHATLPGVARYICFACCTKAATLCHPGVYCFAIG